MVSKIIRKWLRKRLRKTSKDELDRQIKLPFLANFWHFWNFEKWKFLINDSLPELFLIRIREFGMRPQAIWMFYNHSVLNLSFLRLIVKRTKTKKSIFGFEWSLANLKYCRKKLKKSKLEERAEDIAWRREIEDEGAKKKIRSRYRENH